MKDFTMKEKADARQAAVQTPYGYIPRSATFGSDYPAGWLPKHNRVVWPKKDASE